MPFAPIPAEFHEMLARMKTLPFARVLDFGCGQGEFAQIFQDHQLSLWGLDRLPAAAGIEAAIRGNALNPPILSESIDCIVAGNLVRHLLAQDQSGEFLGLWLDLLKPGGDLFIFEDEPNSANIEQENYSLLQAFLARVMAPSRGPLLKQADFRALVSRMSHKISWDFGMAENSFQPDTGNVLQMLKGEGNRPDPATEVGKLCRRINMDGLSYGNFWWAHACVHEPAKESRV